MIYSNNINNYFSISNDCVVRYYNNDYYCLIDDKRMKVYQVVIVSSNKNGQIGEIVDVDNHGMIVKCSDGYIKILDIAMEGKKRCMVRDYFNGIKNTSLVGKVLK